jgi:hypothetical protein
MPSALHEAISVATFGSVLHRKCVAPMRILMVPNGCSTRRQKKAADLKAARAQRKAAGIPEKSHHKQHAPESKPELKGESKGELEGAYVFGARAIGRVTGQTRGQVYYWHAQGMFGDAVWAAGAKSLVGNIQKLRNLSPR